MPLEPPNLNNNVAHQQLLLLTSIKDLKVEFLSKMSEFYFPIDISTFHQENIDFYKELMHPEDYPIYIAHLKSLTGETGKEIYVRLKNRKGTWTKFHFQNRLYTWRLNNEEPVVLSLGREATVHIDDEGIPLKTNGGSDYYIPNNEYEELIQSLDDGFCIIEMIYDKTGKPVDYLYLQTNPAFEKQINFKNVTGKTIRELIPDYKGDRLETYSKVATTGESVRLQFRSENIDNSWLDLLAIKLGDENSRRVAVVFRNITRRKLAEEKLLQAKADLEAKAIRRQKDLEESKELLQTVFDTTSQAIAVFQNLYDEDGGIRDFKFLKVNKVLQEMYLEEDVLGKTYLETTKYGVEIGMYEALKQVVITGKAIDQEFFFDKGGYENWFRMTATPQKDLLIATIEDITERKAESIQLEETVRFKQELVRTSPETIMIINLNTFSVRYINKDIFPDVGMTKERIQGMPLADILPFIHPRDRQKVTGLHRTLLKADDDDIFDLELRLKLKGISWEWFNVRGKIFKRRDPSWVDEYVVLVRNITEQKNTHRDLLEAKKLSIQGEVARTLAHELRNPIASIGMVGEVLAKKLGVSESSKFNNYFKILSRSTKTLNTLVTNLLNSSNYTPAELKKEDLAFIVDRVVEKASDRIYLEGIRLVKKYTGNYPILADKEKLEIALLNIIVNASEATTPQQGIIEVEIAEHKTDFQLSIRDNGHGMEQEEIDRLFEAFYSNKDTGVGVGLSSVKSILEEHDAHYKVWSKPGEGCCFKILFPNTEKE